MDQTKAVEKITGKVREWLNRSGGASVREMRLTRIQRNDGSVIYFAVESDANNGGVLAVDADAADDIALNKPETL